MDHSELRRIAELLLIEQHRIDPSEVRPAEPSTTVGQALLAAAVAVRAGAPGRAIRELDRAETLVGAVLDPSESLVTGALRRAAQAQLTIWLPGDAAPAIDPQGAAPTVHVAGASDDARLIGDLAGVLASVLSDRAFFVVLSALREHKLNEPEDDVIDAVQASWDEKARRIARSGWEPAVAYVRTLTADLLWRAGRPDDANVMLTSVDSTGDDVAKAHCRLVRGDRLAAPVLGPLTYGIALGTTAAPASTTADPEAARSAWADAATRYAATGSRSGRSAAILRLSTDATADPVQRSRQREEALADARTAGDEALETIVVVHAHIAGRLDGETRPGEAVAAVAAWAAGDGSPSFGHGVGRLFSGVAGSVQESGAFFAGRLLLDDAKRLAQLLGGDAEAAGPALVDLFTADYHLLAALFGLARAQSQVASFPPDPSLLDWLSQALAFLELRLASNAGRDPDLLEIGTEMFATIRASQPPLDKVEPSLKSAVLDAVTAVQDSLDELSILVAMFRGQADLQAGWPDVGRARLEQALAEAEGSTVLLAPVYRVRILIDLGRLDEARALAQQIAPGIHPDFAVDLLLNSDDAAGAEREMDRLRAGPPAGTGAERPWEDLGRRARIETALGRPAAGAELADRAVALFEERSARLGRDVLRTQTGDDGRVADAYGAAVRAHIALAEAALDPTGRQAEAEAALDVADAARDGLLSIADTVRDVGADEATRSVIAAWLRAGSAWPAAVERAARTLVDDRQIDVSAVVAATNDAESMLAEAESALLLAAPSVLEQRKGRPAGTATSVRQSLPDGTMLMEYHLSGETLTVFTVTRSTTSAHRLEISGVELLGMIGRVQRACTDWQLPDETDLHHLSDLLLAPATAELAGHERVVVVPHKQLSVLPFHLLPMPGRDDAIGIDHITSILPTAGLVPTLAARDRGPRLDRGALVLGDPDFAPGTGLPRLVGTETEARAVAACFGVDPLLHGDARLDALQAGARGRSILHLATHGVLEPTWPHLAHLPLAGGDELSMGDLMATSLGCDLVVLSACHSGEGRPTAAGDVVGLARATLVAGVSHLIGTLCPVDDAAACVFAIETMRRVSQGEGVVDAVNAARNRLRGLSSIDLTNTATALGLAHGSGPARRGPRGVEPERPPSTELPAGAAPLWAPFVAVGL
jgi:CHAT domain-containing protein